MRMTARMPGDFLIWSPMMLLFSSEKVGRRQGGYLVKLGAGEVDMLSEGLISKPFFYLLTPYVLPWCPLPGYCLKPFAPQPSQGLVYPSPSYTASKLLFFLFSFATARFGEHNPSQQFTLRYKKPTQLPFTFKATRSISFLTPPNWKLVEWEAMEDRGHFKPKDFHIALKDKPGGGSRISRGRRRCGFL